MSTVLVVGAGGREHALAWLFAQQDSVERVLVAPGNAGTALDRRCENVAISATDTDGLVDLARRERVDLVVIGPEDPLVDGVVDALAAAEIPAFGPSTAAAQLEGSKAHCKDFLLRHEIPTADAVAFTDVDDAIAHLGGLERAPVVKASGLAAGKGVIVATDHDEAAASIREILVDGRFGAAGTTVLLEERLDGTELSVLAFCDGDRAVVMPPAQDHKRLLAGDEGPNTGGMGAFVPSPVADSALVAQIQREVFEPTLAALRAEGRPYRGALYAGMMLTSQGPKVIEFNCRFGDPETQALSPLLVSDPVAVFGAAASGALADVDIEWSGDASVAVVMASQGYPLAGTAPVPIEGLDAAVESGCTVFHAGTSLIDGAVHASGGRVLAVTARAPRLADAAAAAHRGVEMISFEGAQYRSDIARTAALAEPRDEQT